MTREEFQRKWMDRLTCLGWWGVSSAIKAYDSPEGATARHARMQKVPDEVAAILKEFEADLTVVLRAEHTAKAAQQSTKSK